MSTIIKSFKDFGLPDEDKQAIRDYVSANKAQWDNELSTDKKISKFIHRRESGLLFAIEYFADKTYLMHTNLALTKGEDNYFYSADIEKEVLYVRCKSKSTEAQQQLIQEIKTIDSLEPSRGVIKYVRSSYYAGKQGKKKFHAVKEFQHGDFHDLRERNLSDAELKMIVLDLMHGLATIHDKGLLINNCNGAPFQFQLESNVVTSCGFDLSKVLQESPNTRFKEAQHTQVSKLLSQFDELHADNPSKPLIFSQLYALKPASDNPNVYLKAKITARKAYELLCDYYNNPQTFSLDAKWMEEQNKLFSENNKSEPETPNQTPQPQKQINLNLDSRISKLKEISQKLFNQDSNVSASNNDASAQPKEVPVTEPKIESTSKITILPEPKEPVKAIPTTATVQEPTDLTGKIAVIVGVVFLLGIASGVLVASHPGTVIYNGGGLILTLPAVITLGAGGAIALCTIAIGSYLWWKNNRQKQSAESASS